MVGGAGYDGRALRYQRPGVRWYEIDHPATQADKRERLARLNLQTGHIRFVSADFAVDPIAAPLIAAGLDPSRPALFLLEGVAVYLERPVLERVLAAFASVAAPGSTLAINVPSGRADPAARRRFADRVAAIGEPVRSMLTPEQAGDLLAAAGWEVTAGPDRGRSAGLLLARAATTEDRRERAVPTAVPAMTRPSATPAAVPPDGLSPDGLSPDGLPLSALLSPVLVAFTIEADNEVEHRLPHRTQMYGPSPGAPAGAALADVPDHVGELPAVPARRGDQPRGAAPAGTDGHQPGRHAPLGLRHVHPRPEPGPAGPRGRDRPADRRGHPRPRRLADRDGRGRAPLAGPVWRRDHRRARGRARRRGRRTRPRAARLPADPRLRPGQRRARAARG